MCLSSNTCKIMVFFHGNVENIIRAQTFVALFENTLSSGARHATQTLNQRDFTLTLWSIYPSFYCHARVTRFFRVDVTYDRALISVDLMSRRFSLLYNPVIVTGSWHSNSRSHRKGAAHFRWVWGGWVRADEGACVCLSMPDMDSQFCPYPGPLLNKTYNAHTIDYIRIELIKSAPYFTKEVDYGTKFDVEIFVAAATFSMRMVRRSACAFINCGYHIHWGRRCTFRINRHVTFENPQ